MTEPAITTLSLLAVYYPVFYSPSFRHVLQGGGRGGVREMRAIKCLEICGRKPPAPAKSAPRIFYSRQFSLLSLGFFYDYVP
jgi:hypothetical protein